MSEFYDLIDELLGDDDALTDISVTVRRAWFYDFAGEPLRIWQGKGKLFTSDGNQWLGTIDANNLDHHQTPSIQDGRDGSSATYTMGLTIPDLPGQDKLELFEALKADQSLAVGRKVTCYLVVFQEGEGLRPITPLSFFKELIMFSPKFSETIERVGDMVTRLYKISMPCKDANYGRSNIPNGTYADTVQKRRASELGVSVDRGSEFLALLANKTFQIP
jgi:hypothetical protein